MFTPYSKNWFSLPKPAPAGRIRSIATPERLPAGELPTVAHWGLAPGSAEIVEPGERAARGRMKARLAPGGPVETYARHRNFPAVGGTSRLSQDLRLSLIHI